MGLAAAFQAVAAPAACCPLAVSEGGQFRRARRPRCGATRGASLAASSSGLRSTVRSAAMPAAPVSRASMALTTRSSARVSVGLAARRERETASIFLSTRRTVVAAMFAVVLEPNVWGGSVVALTPSFRTLTRIQRPVWPTVTILPPTWSTAGTSTHGACPARPVPPGRASARPRTFTVRRMARRRCASICSETSATARPVAFAARRTAFVATASAAANRTRRPSAMRVAADTAGPGGTAQEGSRVVAPWMGASRAEGCRLAAFLVAASLALVRRLVGPCPAEGRGG